MNTRLVNTAAGVINAALTQNRTATGTLPLESAQLLMSPKTAAELERLRAQVEALESAAYGDASVRLLTPVEQIGHLHSAVAAQLHRADTLNRLCREKNARIAELEAAPKAAFRASHDSIGMGTYTTAAEARRHCEAEERHSWPTGTNLSFDWIEDEEDGVAELVVTAGQNEESVTGYVVTPVEIAAAYDEGADA